MAKLIGTIRIAPNPGSETMQPHFEVVFVPYAGKVNALTARVNSHEDLVTFLMELKIGEDDATRWAGKARSQGVVLISGVERTEAFLKECGLLA